MWTAGGTSARYPSGLMPAHLGNWRLSALAGEIRVSGRNMPSTLILVSTACPRVLMTATLHITAIAGILAYL